ncbi:hypothetical protein R6Q59_013718 [Mikania micrantha]
MLLKNHPVELIAKFLKEKVHAGNKGTSEEELERTLDKIAIALFANSSFIEGKPNGYLIIRSQIWTDNDNDHVGMLSFVFDDTFGTFYHENLVQFHVNNQLRKSPPYNIP